MNRVLALDVGTTMARAALFRADGSADGTPVKHLHRGVEDPYELLELVRELAGRAGGSVDAVAASCFWHSLVAVDRRGGPLTPILGWRGLDAADDADALASRLDAVDVHRRTGCPLHPAYWPAKLAWLRRTRPDVWGAADRFVSFSELLFAALAGASHTSPSMASGTGLLRVDGSGWDEELLGVLELDPARLPEVSDDPAGAGIPWFPPLGDGACANVGMGAVDPGRAGLSVGTSGALRVVVDEPVDPHPALFLLRVDGGRFVLGGALSDAGNLYHHLLRSLRLDPAAADELSERHPGAGGLVVLPLPGGERSPGWDARARGAVAGLSYDTTPLDLFHAALEGVALRFAAVLEHLSTAREVVVAGGSMASRPAWLQVLADALGLPVLRSAVDEASARGAAVRALERLGAEPEPAVTAERYEPRPERSAALRGLLQRQRALLDASRVP